MIPSLRVPRRFVLLLLWTVALVACGPTPDPGAAGGHATSTAIQVITRHSVDSDGHTMAVWEKSPTDPKAILLLVHGRTWSTVPNFDLHVLGENLSLMDGLVERGIAAFGVDLRGYGETPRDSSGWTTPNRAADDVANVLRWIRDRHGSTPVHLFGWSQGSRVAQLVAQRHPGAVNSLVVFGYPHRPGDRPVQMPEGVPPRMATTAEGAASDFITPGSISQVAMDTYVARALAADPVRSDWTHLHEFNALDPSKVTVPTLILQGELDPVGPSELQMWLFDGLATDDKSWVVLPGGDHAAFLETPRPYFLSTLESFLLRGGM
jgi:pimeloyl-ACP methyl ester carboxylesterase